MRHWHLRANDNRAVAACGVPMPDKQPASPACGDCIARRLGPLFAEGPRESARDKYGDPRLKRKK